MVSSWTAQGRPTSTQIRNGYVTLSCSPNKIDFHANSRRKGIRGRCWRSVSFELYPLLHPVHPPVRLQVGVGLCALHPLDRRLWRFCKRTFLLQYLPYQTLTKRLTDIPKMYIHEHPEGNNDIRRMKHAVWVDLVNMLLWLVIAVSALAYWFKHRHTRSQFTSRAIV